MKYELKTAQVAFAIVKHLHHLGVFVSARARGMGERIALCGARAAQRRTLSELPPEALRDIGIMRGQAIAESRKLPWEA